jgi:hypothetical protein
MARETFADEFDGPDLDRHPMQMMIAVFDFPEMTTGDDDDLVSSWSSSTCAGMTIRGEGRTV